MSEHAAADTTVDSQEDVTGLGYEPDAPPSEEAQGIQYEDEGEGFSFNMNDETASSGFPVYPAGTYDSVAVDCTYKISKSSGNPMWEIQWQYEVQVPDPKNQGAMITKSPKIRSYVVFSPEQRGRAKMFCARVVPELAKLEDFNPKLLAPQVIGAKARLKLNIQKNTQDGSDQNNVQDVLAPSASSTGGSFNL